MATKVILDAANVVSNITFAIPSMAGNPDNFIDTKCDVKKGNVLKGLCMPSKVYVSAEGEKTIYMPTNQCNKDNPQFEKIKTLHEDGTDSIFEEGEREIEIQGKGWGADEQNPATAKSIGGDLTFTSKVSLFCWETLDFTKFDQNTSSLYLTYGMARIQQIAERPKVQYGRRRRNRRNINDTGSLGSFYYFNHRLSGQHGGHVGSTGRSYGFFMATGQLFPFHCINALFW